MDSVLIADDHPAIRAGLTQLILATNPLLKLGEATTAAEVVERLSEGGWNVLVLDLGFPDQRGTTLVRDICTQFASTRVLVVSGLPEEQYAVEVLRAGAYGFLSKQSAPDEFGAAVRRVLGGHRYVSAKLAEQMANDVGQPPVPRHELLSDRERQVFVRLAVGTQITAIAQELDLSIKTVSTYRSRILEKMRFRSNADITSYALRHEVTDIPAEPREP